MLQQPGNQPAHRAPNDDAATHGPTRQSTTRCSGLCNTRLNVNCCLTEECSSRVWSMVLTVPGTPCSRARAGGANPRGEAMSISFPGESADYRAARDRLLEQEIEQRRATEAVATARRALPPGGVVPQDYLFQREGTDGAPTDVRLSELFAPGMDSLVIYSFMFPRDPGDGRPGPDAGQTALLPLAEGPCPSCTAFLDQLDGAAEHAGQRINLAVVAKS